MSEMETKKCEVCGAEYVPAYPPMWKRSKYCSDKCRKEAVRNWQRSYYSEHRDEINEKDRNRRMNNPHVVCKLCGKVIDKRKESVQSNSSIQYHEHCVMLDTLDTLRDGSQLTRAQRSRLESRGWGLKDFREEFADQI